MSDQFNNEPLEKFFHDHLDQYGEEPGEGFWDELEPRIPPPPKKKRYYLPTWWLVWVGALLLVGFYFWSKERAFHDLSEQVTNNQEQIEAIKEASSGTIKDIKSVNKKENNSGSNSEENPQTSNTQNRSEEKVEAKNENNTDRSLTKQQWLKDTKDRNTNLALAEAQKIKSEVSTANEISNFSGELSNAFSTILKKEKEKEGSGKTVPIKEDQTKSQKIIETEDRTLLDTFSSLNLKTMELENSELELTIKDWGFDSLDLIREPKMKLAVGVFYESWFRTMLNQNIQTNSFIEPQTSPSGDFFYQTLQPTGRNLGISIGIPINRNWRIQTGLGWTKMELAAKGDVDLVYNKVGAFEEPGNHLYNNYQFQFNRALGGTTFTAEIGHRLQDMPEDNPQQDSTFTILFAANDKNDYLHLPLHLEYSKGIKRFNFSLGLGIDVFQLMKSETTILMTDSLQNIENFDDLEFVVRNPEFSGEPGGRPTGLKRTFLGGRATLGMDYQLHKRWHLRLDGAYHFGLTPVTKIPDPSSNDFAKKAKLNYWLARVGIQYHF